MDAISNPIFQALLKEAQFTNEMLEAGATQIRQVNYARKGIYFQSLTSLSTGLERIGKICIMLDYYIENGGKFPDFSYVKRISHNIEDIYNKTLDIKQKHQLTSSFLQDLNGQIYQSIISIISSFAVGDRYSNINLLVRGVNQPDPIARWFTEVDLTLYRECVTERKKKAIESNARLVAEQMDAYTNVTHISETGEIIDSVYKGSILTGIQESVAPHRQRHVIHVIRFWTDLIWRLQYKAMELGKPEIPFFGEIFGGFNNDDSYIRTRKRWDTD